MSDSKVKKVHFISVTILSVEDESLTIMSSGANTESIKLLLYEQWSHIVALPMVVYYCFTFNRVSLRHGPAHTQTSTSWIFNTELQSELAKTS